MNTAVPSTRVGGATSMLWMNIARGSASAESLSISNARPRFHVVSSVNTTAPTASGNQPPSGILIEFDARKPRSMSVSGTAIASAIHRFQFHNRRITMKIKIESISIASVTAMP